MRLLACKLRTWLLMHVLNWRTNHRKMAKPAFHNILSHTLPDIFLDSGHMKLLRHRRNAIRKVTKLLYPIFPRKRARRTCLPYAKIDPLARGTMSYCFCQQIGDDLKAAQLSRPCSK